MLLWRGRAGGTSIRNKSSDRTAGAFQWGVGVEGRYRERQGGAWV